MHNDYSLAIEKIEVKEKMLSKYQVMIADLYIFPIGNVKKLIMPNFFDKENHMLHHQNLQLYLRLGLKLKKY